MPAHRALSLVLCLALSLPPAAAHAGGASARLVYDAANLKLNSGNGYKTHSNASGTLAWGESYIMMSYAAMFRGTGEASYLVSLADHALSVLDQRDSAKKLKDWAGKSRPCWQATKYSSGNKPYCWVVHSGMIAYPMIDLVWLVKQNPALSSVPVSSTMTLNQAATKVLAEVEKVVATHDFQYVSGPKSGEGYYRGDPAAKAVVPTVAGKALPLNQMNTMGRTLVLLWKVTAKSAYLTKAKALATYLRNRMKAYGATYVWTYWGSTWSKGGGEDISHAAINADFAVLCHEHGLVFSTSDMQRLGRTLFDNIHKDTNTAADRVDGTGTSGSYKWAVGRWLNLSPYEPRVWPVAANIYRSTTSSTSGQVILSLANVARHAPPIREYTFYPYDWTDMGSYKKAAKYGANILLLPPDPKKHYALRLGYRASRAASVDQWKKPAYHKNHRLAITSGSAFTWVYVPYDPAIHYPYSGPRVLYQFTDSFSSGKGIEVMEVAAVKDPQILTSSAPAAKVGQAYSLTAKGSGDKPLLWGLAPGAPLGMKIGLQSGIISWTPSPGDVPGVSITLKLENDSGEASAKLSISVQGLTPDAGISDAGIPDARVQDLAGLADQGGKDSSPRDGKALLDQAASNDSVAGDQSVVEGGCQCRAGGAPPDWTLLSLLALGALIRRRRATEA